MKIITFSSFIVRDLEDILLRTKGDHSMLVFIQLKNFPSQSHDRIR